MPANMRVAQVALGFGVKVAGAIVVVAGELLTESTPRTPYKKGELRGRRRVRPHSKGAYVHWFAGHAAVQNAGRRAGARPFTNYTTAGTGSDFVGRTFTPDNVAKKLQRHLK